MKKFLLGFLVALVLLIGGSKFVLADGASVSLTVKNNGDVVYSGSVALLPAGTISINDSSGNPHDANADSVLSVVNTAAASSTEFNISNLIYYDAFGAFYLKCMNVSGSELCNNWQYKVDDVSPAVGMDSEILSGGENVVLYFGDDGEAPAPTPPAPAPEPETTPAHSSSGSSGGGYITPNTICEQGEKFSVTTGQPCTSFISPPAPVSPPLTSPPSNTSPTKKLPGYSPTGESKPVLPSAPKKQIKKANEILNQNTAATINTITPPSLTPQTGTPKNNWWGRFWEKILSVF